MNILIGDISSYKAIVVAKYISLNYPLVKIFGFDKRPFTKKIFTKYATKNFVISENRVEVFLELIKKHEIDLFIPVINDSLDEIWRSKQHFGNSLEYLGDYEDFRILNDKNLLHDLADQLNLPVPRKYENIEEAKIPFVIKPTNLSSSKGVVYVDSEKSIPKLKPDNNHIIQQYVKGVGVGFSFYCKNGKISNSYGHRRLAEYPSTGGSSTYRIGYEDNRMNVIAERIVSHLDYTGFAMFEFKLTEDNELFLLEVNPRIWGSINQGLVNGVNYFEDILGNSKNNNSKQRYYLTYLSPLFYLSLIGYISKLKFSPVFIFFRNIFKNKADVHLFNDFKGYTSLILRKINGG